MEKSDSFLRPPTNQKSTFFPDKKRVSMQASEQYIDIKVSKEDEGLKVFNQESSLNISDNISKKIKKGVSFRLSINNKD